MVRHSKTPKNSSAGPTSGTKPPEPPADGLELPLPGKGDSDPAATVVARTDVAGAGPVWAESAIADPAATDPGGTPPRRPGSATVLAEEAPEVIEQRTVARLRDLMRTLTKALKAKKMYPANNPVLSRILIEFQDAMMGTLEDLEELTLSVQPADLLHNGASVYHNPAKRDSLATRFHRDGITEIQFASGLTPPELNAFLDVLARATEPQGAEEDLVTLLWEQEFSHINYAYIAIDDLHENLLAGVPVPEGSSAEEMTHIPWPTNPETTCGLDILFDPRLDGEDGSGERSDDWNELIPTVDITERCPAELLQLNSQELQDLAEEIHLEHSRPLTEVALEILTEVAEDERNAERFSDLARALADLVVIALTDADLTRATQVLATLRTLSAERGVDAAGYLPDTGDMARQAVASIHHFPEADTSSLPEFLAHLGAHAIDPVCELLDNPAHAPLHPQLAAGLSLLAQLDTARVGERLTRAVNPAAGHILAALAASPFPGVEAILGQAIEHREARVRKDAVLALLARHAAGKPELCGKVARALEDSDPQVRNAALQAAREIATEEMGASLLAIVEHPDFRERSSAEKRSFFEALARLQQAFLKKTLREWSARHLWWPDAAATERRALAAWALARTGDPEDRAHLSRHSHSIFPGVRKACRRALDESPEPPTARPNDGQNLRRAA